ncbi:MAG: hypothetical protein JXR49_14345 [Acidobacteria bacterium]|nr:hypothetical protein [Acidobacteriota bacterium]
MWKLIKADSEYFAISHYIMWSIILILVISNSILGGMEETIAIIMFFTALFFGGGMASESAKTKRIRMLSTLPLSARKLGLFYQWATVIEWILCMTLLFISSLISQRGNLGLEYVWWILTRIGCMFIFAGFMDLANNLFFCVKEKKPDKIVFAWFIYPFLWMAAIIGGLLLYLFTISPGDKPDWPFININEFVSTFHGSFGILLLGLIILALNVYVYERRRSYLEEFAIAV